MGRYPAYKLNYHLRQSMVISLLRIRCRGLTFSLRHATPPLPTFESEAVVSGRVGGEGGGAALL